MSNMKNMGTELIKERLKEIKRLHDSKERADKGLFIMEGVRLMEEAVKENISIEEVLYTARLGDSERGSQILTSLRREHTKTFQVTEKIMESISETENPQGILAVAKQLRWTLQDVIINKTHTVIVCGLQDPGNLGTIIRTADAGGCGGVITIRNTVDVYNPKVIRSTMGSLFRLPVVKFEDTQDVISSLKEEGYQVVATTAHSKTSYIDLDYTTPTAFLIGQEAAGLFNDILESADKKVFIPMKKGVESLNAAISASILIYEAFRQRLIQSASSGETHGSHVDIS